MNLTELNSNKTNYDRYLQRMTDSCEKSSKGLIPVFCKGKVLDVGCGSGVLLEKLSNAEGIDLNLNSVIACREKGLVAHHMPLDQVEKHYDTIVFSSVLHEFSSYSSFDRYTRIPILKALLDAKYILNPKGRLVIRDGVEANIGTTTVEAVNNKVINDLLQYAKDAPMFSEKDIMSIKDRKITANRNFLKEFMFTYTWGKESYYREVQEKFGILTVSDWKQILEEAGFNITMMKTFSEEYVQYLSKHFVNNIELKRLLNDSTILLIAEKI